MSKEKMFNSGIYLILNCFNGKVYIGSSINLKTRRNDHFNKLHHGSHTNTHLQRAFMKYPDESFIFQVIEYLPPLRSFLLEREDYYLDFYKSTERKFGYNIIDKSHCYWKCNVGIEHLERSKASISLKNSGENNGMSVLSYHEVSKIREMYNSDSLLTNEVLAKKFGVSTTLITLILNNKRWYDKDFKKNYKLAGLFINDIKRIRNEYNYKKIPLLKIMDDNNICRNTLAKILNNKLCYDPSYQRIVFTRPLKIDSSLFPIIRKRYSDGEKLREIAHDYSVVLSTISNIINYKRKI